jgi:hypothetical protein
LLSGGSNRRTVVVVTDKKDLSWTEPEPVFQSSTTDKHLDNTKAIGYYNEPALVFLANEIPSIPSSDVYVKPNLIFESTTIVTCQVNALEGRQLGSYASHVSLYFFLFLPVVCSSFSGVVVVDLLLNF